MSNSKESECQTILIHDEVVQKVRNAQPEQDVLNYLGEFFRIFGDPTRIKILQALFISEMCVCDIAAVLEINRSAVSHQLKILRQANLVKYRKEGKSAIYSLSDNHVKKIIDQGMSHIME